MKIVTWNCHYGLTEEKARKMADWAGADIYFVQEAGENDVAKYPSIEECLGRQWSWYSDHMEYENNGRDIYGTNHDLGIAVFTREYRVMRSNEGLEQYRYIVPYDVCNNDGKKIFTAFHVWTKASTHLSKATYADIANEAMAYYADKTDGLPFILLGDFNFGPHKDKYFPHFDEKLKSLVNVTRLGNEELTYRHNSKEYNCPNDCIYVSPQWNVSGPILGEDCGSDHRPVMAELTLAV